MKTQELNGEYAPAQQEQTEDLLIRIRSQTRAVIEGIADATAPNDLSGLIGAAIRAQESLEALQTQAEMERAMRLVEAAIQASRAESDAFNAVLMAGRVAALEDLRAQFESAVASGLARPAPLP